MQVHFYVVVVGAALLDNGPSNQRVDSDKDRESAVIANDNGVRWPLITFPEDWYASL